MAVEVYLNIIRQGAAAWNEWRKKNPEVLQPDLSGAFFTMANLRGAFLFRANLNGASLSGAQLIQADLSDADLTGCHIYGIFAWGLKLSDATKQRDLLITPPYEAGVTTDDIEIAQFLYLLIHNQKIRKVIDTITSKVVLILGRFTPPERKQVLDALRDELRRHNYLPVVFDFDVPENRDISETVSLLARMARFIIADLTDRAASRRNWKR
jgi:hypothetical protein